jgi:NTE family protein
MDCDLVLEGGGVKGIGLVGAVAVLAERGYRFRRVAGSSAGAIVGALVAAGVPADRLAELVHDVDYRQFRDPGWLDRVPLVGPALSVLFENGVFEGDAVRRWVDDRLREAGVRTFGDLRIDDDEGTALPEGRRYRLVVTASDVSSGRLVRLPWDYPRYGLDPDEQPVADAVRASASIPFFYEPVELRGRGGARSTLVDGGLLSNFPIDTFDRDDGRPPRWPTFGVKLSARPEANQVPRPVSGPFGLATAMLRTMVNARDQMHLDDPCVVDRTIFVDTGTVDSVDFDLSEADQRLLFGNGRSAAEEFLAGWDWDGHRARCRGAA